MKSSAKRISILLLSCFTILSTAACNKTSVRKPSPAPSEQVTQNAEPSPDKTDSEPKESPKVNTSINKIEAGLGELKFYYNKNWTYNAEQSPDSSIAFTRGDTLLGVMITKETTYQIGSDMMQKSLNIAKSQYDDLKMIEEMKKVNVNGDTWYQCIYQTGSGDHIQYSLQRTFGNKYNAYTFTYTGLKDDFEAFKSNAMTVLDSCIMTVPETTSGETEAKNELVGELDAGQYGYLELKKDGTYYWYSNSSKKMDNVHYGTYLCDNKITSIELPEGRGGFYLALFPSKYFVNGEETDMGSYKIDFAISKNSTGKGDYQAVNMTNSTVYDFERIK